MSLENLSSVSDQTLEICGSNFTGVLLKLILQTDVLSTPVKLVSATEHNW